MSITANHNDFIDASRVRALAEENMSSSSDFTESINFKEPFFAELTFKSSIAELHHPWYVLRCVVCLIDKQIALRPWWNLRLRQQVDLDRIVGLRRVDASEVIDINRLNGLRLPFVFKSHFVDALKSGLYPCSSSLRHVMCFNGEYTVLGVACKCVGIQDSLLKFDSDIPHNNPVFRDVPDLLKAMSSHDALFVCRTLCDLQHAGFSFSRIADFVTKYL